MKLSRRSLVQAAAIAALGCLVSLPAFGQAVDYPNRPVTLILPTAPGGAAGTVARILADQLSQTWGQPVVVEARAGAGGVIGTAAVAKAKPDGYTLLLGFSEHSWMNYFSPKPPFDMNRDFTPVMLIGNVADTVATNAAVPAKSLPELVAYLKANPGKANFGSGGVGSTLHLFGELFKKQAGVDIVHVPFKGAADSNVAMVGGQIEMSFPTALSIKPHVDSGRVKVLAVTAKERLALFPDVPTVGEVGLPDFLVSIWFCIFAPADIPKDVLAKLSAELVKAGNAPGVRERLEKLGLRPVMSTPDEFNKFFRAEQSRWSSVIESANIKFE